MKNKHIATFHAALRSRDEQDRALANQRIVEATAAAAIAAGIEIAIAPLADIIRASLTHPLTTLTK